MWGVLGLVLLVSIVGKGVACWAAARLNGVPRREALALGSLMNARGLMELILLNLGLQAGVITPTLYTILVLMAVVTTLMASPLFELFYGRYRPDGAGEIRADAVAERSDAIADPAVAVATTGATGDATTTDATATPSPSVGVGTTSGNGEIR